MYHLLVIPERGIYLLRTLVLKCPFVPSPLSVELPSLSKSVKIKPPFKGSFSNDFFNIINSE